MPPLTTTDGGPIGAVYGFVSMLIGVIQNLEPTHIAVAFDRKERLRRKDKFEAYHANRPKMDSDLDIQFFKLALFLEAAKIPAFSSAGFEADDVIGTLATKALEGGENKDELINEVVIATGDRDILQLINDKVKVYMPVKGVVDGKLYGKEEVVERLGVTPENVVDYKALVGDASDNYPGVTGVGPKTAIDLITKYGSFENIYKNISDISPRIVKKLIDGKAGGEMSLDLAKIETDVPIDWNGKTSSNWKLDSKEVIELFNEFGFKTLTARIKSAGEKIEARKQLTLL